MAVTCNQAIELYWSLVKKGADVHTLGTDGHTPLSLAISKGFYSSEHIIDCLISLGANAEDLVKAPFTKE